MMVRRFAGLVVGATILAIGLGVAPAAAAQAPNAPDPATLVAGSPKDPQTGKNRVYLVGQGENVPAELGVTNGGDTAVDGLVIQIRILDDLDFTKKFDNCYYATYTNMESAVCEFDANLAPGASLALTGAGVSTSAGARPDKISSIVFQWFSKQWADQAGGIEALANRLAGQGTKATAGDGDPLSLATPTESLVGPGGPIGFGYVRLDTPPTTGPSPTAAPSGTPTVAPGTGGGDGGALPLTGANTATAVAVGGALLLVGAAGYVIARRRRTRFVA
jgi:LPXTG-motif cell wall-anchored protein